MTGPLTRRGWFQGLMAMVGASQLPKAPNPPAIQYGRVPVYRKPGGSYMDGGRGQEYEIVKLIQGDIDRAVRMVELEYARSYPR